MYCSGCGNNLTGAVRFCPRCGAPVNQARPVQPIRPVQPVQPVRPVQPVQPVQPPPGAVVPPGPPAVMPATPPSVKVKHRHYGWILVLLLVLGAAGFYIVRYGIQTPTQTLEAFCEDMSTLDYSSAFSRVAGGSEDLYDDALGVMGDLMDIDLGLYGDLLQGLGGFTAGMGLIPSVEVEIKSIEYIDGNSWYDAEHCTVYAVLVLKEPGFDEPYYEDWTVDMCRSGLKWLIDPSALEDMF